MSTRWYLTNIAAEAGPSATAATAATDAAHAGSDRNTLLALGLPYPTGPAHSVSWQDDGQPSLPHADLLRLWASPPLAAQTLAAETTLDILLAAGFPALSITRTFPADDAEGTWDGDWGNTTAGRATIVDDDTLEMTLDLVAGSQLVLTRGLPPVGIPLTLLTNAAAVAITGAASDSKVWDQEADAECVFDITVAGSYTLTLTANNVNGDYEYDICTAILSVTYQPAYVGSVTPECFVWLYRSGTGWVETLLGTGPTSRALVSGSAITTPGQQWRKISGTLTGEIAIEAGDQIICEAWLKTTTVPDGHDLFGYAGNAVGSAGQAVSSPACYLEFDTTIQVQGELIMATITSITEKLVKPGDTVHITGTGFVATQTTGTVLVGGKALASPSWADTAISGTIASDAAPGIADVVITPSTGTAVTLTSALMIYDPADGRANDQLKLGLLGSVYIDGLQCGYAEGNVELVPAITTHVFTPNDRVIPVKTWIIANQMALKLTLAQVSGENMALALGGTYDPTTGALAVIQSFDIAEHAVAWTDAYGAIYLCPRVQFEKLPGLVFNPAAHRTLVLDGTALALPDGRLFAGQLPTDYDEESGDRDDES
jgi:hypothetical protein